ncbi:PspC domain-containing protein [Citricoccus sp. SGAir0253]|uniref:PspC domain-containing protein n=1 Tax=Citricoccus sp. SGAir0253 TaxID=2567881 RepID=UPI0011075DDD|nr:PspC domain-containing protein [Citricoccus sp. SGAir0253]QCU77443.1 PspC domain-containing protein [Citricoccus sp. SGAir0253]
MNENPASGFYAWIHSLRTVRPPQRWLGGVVAGTSDRLGLDRTLGRALFVVLALLTDGVAVLAYGLAWMVLPEPDGRIHAREAARGRWTSGMTGALVLAVLGLGSLLTPPYGREAGWWGWGSVLGLAVVGLFVWLVASRPGPRALPPGQQPATGPGTDGGPVGDQPVYLAPSDTGWYATPTPAGPPAAPVPPGSPLPPAPAVPPVPEGRDPMSAPHAPYPSPHPSPHAGPHAGPYPTAPAAAAPPVDRTPPSLTGPTQLLVVGIAVLAGAAVAALRYLGVFTAGWSVIWAASLATALGVMAVGLVVGAVLGRGGGGLTVVTAILVLPVLAATGAASLRVGDWDGDWDGTLRGDARTGYHLSFGTGTIDLTDEPARTAADPVGVDLSFSTAELRVPDDVDVYLTVDNAFSTVDYPDLPAGASTADGRVQVVDAPGTERLDVEADLAFSTLTVRVDGAPARTDSTTGSTGNQE